MSEAAANNPVHHPVFAWLSVGALVIGTTVGIFGYLEGLRQDLDTIEGLVASVVSALRERDREHETLKTELTTFRGATIGELDELEEFLSVEHSEIRDALADDALFVDLNYRIGLLTQGCNP